MKRKPKLMMTSVLLSCFLALAGCNSEKTQSTGENEAKSNYPEKPIEAIVAYSAGGGTDAAARTVLQFAEKYADTSFQVVNKPGASGSLGFTAIAQAPTDGYTIGMINAPSVIFQPIMQADSVKYKIDDFSPIANIVTDPGAIFVNADSPIKTFDDFIAAAKKNPGKLKIAYQGPGTIDALALRRLEESAGIELSKVPFEGHSPGYTALLGGHVDVQISNASEVYPQYKDNTARVIAIGSEERIDMMEDVPTYKESGFDFVQVSMRGFAAPKDMDPEQVKYLGDVIKQVIEDPEFQKKAEEMALPLDYIGSEEYAEVLKNQHEEYQAEFEKNPW